MMKIGVRMQSHHPTIRAHNGRWVVDCPECQMATRTYRGAAQGDLPIGIGMPLESRLTAERLSENHAARQNQCCLIGVTLPRSTLELGGVSHNLVELEFVGHPLRRFVLYRLKSSDWRHAAIRSEG